MTKKAVSSLYLLVIVIIVAMTSLAGCSKKETIVTPPVLAITSINPTSGQAGTVVTITGTAFGEDIAKVIVAFNNVAATVSSCTATQIVATVPATASTGKVSVTVDGKKVEGPVFKIQPTITSFAPTSGVVDDIISINGSGFSTVPADNIVTIGGVPCTVTAATATNLKIKVPANANTAKIVVTLSSLSAETATAFTILHGVWIQKADFAGQARTGALGFAIGNKGYVTVGNTTGRENDLWEYDAAANTWTKKANFAGDARDIAVGFVLGDKAYVGLGMNNSGQMKYDLWEYNPSLNNWTQKADFPGWSAFHGTSFTINNKAYVTAGYGGGVGFSRDTWEYDAASNVWTKKADYTGDPMIYCTGFSIGDKGYIVTGFNNYTNPTIKGTTWQYDQPTNTWSQKADFGGGARFRATGFVINGKAYVGTGALDINSGLQKDMWQYDPATNNWTAVPDISGGAREQAASFTIGGKGYITTGNCTIAGNENNLWVFIP